MAYWQKAPVPRHQLVLFPESLEDRIPDDHPVRLLDEILNGTDWKDWEAAYNGEIGQPGIHPSVVTKVILYGLLRRTRSSRQIEYALTHNIDFIWLASGRSIDHTTICNFRTEHEKELRNLFRDMNRKAIELGVSKLGEVCIDGSRIKANASRSHTLTADKVQKQLQHLDAQLNAAMEEMKHNDELDELFDEPSGDKLPPDLADVAVRKAKLEEMLQQLEEMDAARRKSGIDPAKNPAQLSENDTDARVLPNKEGGYAPNFTPMAITETTNGFIVGADVLIGNDEHVHTISMFDTLTDEYGESPRAALADSAFATGTNIAEFEERDIELIAPLPEGETPSENPAIRDDVTKPVPQDQIDKLPMSKQTKRFDKSAFIYDEEKDVYHCPAGKELTFRYPETVNQRGQRVERRTYQCGECADCCLVELCRTNPQGKGGRRISRNQYEAHLQRHREKMNREETKERYKRRLHYGETQFAFIKEWLGLRQFQLHGIDKVRQEWLWSCTAFNLKKLMNLWRTLCAPGAHNPA